MMTLLIATALIIPVCAPDERPVKFCDVIDRCWIECVEDDGGPGGLFSPEGPSNGIPGTPRLGNPGNAKPTGKAGEKGMDNESPSSGTRGNSGKGGKK